MRLKYIAILMVIGLALSATAAKPALASSKPKKQPPDFVFDWGVVSGNLYLSKRGTQRLGIGLGASSTFAAALPPPANVLVSAGLSALAAQAAWAASEGKCIRVKLTVLPFVPPIVPIIYGPSDKNGRYCR